MPTGDLYFVSDGLLPQSRPIRQGGVILQIKCGRIAKGGQVASGVYLQRWGKNAKGVKTQRCGRNAKELLLT